MSMPRKKQKTIFLDVKNVENFDEKRSRSPKNNLKNPFEQFCSGGSKFAAKGLVMIILQISK
jgi:hypothetical protein